MVKFTLAFLQNWIGKGRATMARCANCGKTTTFGHNRSFSMRATRRTFRPNLQRVQVMEDGQLRQKVLCAKCIKRIGRL
ncbi:MAG: 50S ribosomal protein L28 [Anaerolineales bacterium]